MARPDVHVAYAIIIILFVALGKNVAFCPSKSVS